MARWDYFVILAGQRTGSNFLAANLNEYDGIDCHGELFNPYFIGNTGVTERWGVTLDQRYRDPMRLIAAMREKSKGMAGFRLFRGHDQRVLDAVLADPRVAKVILTRNPLDSFLSLQIAETTDIWRISDLDMAKTARVPFDRAAFRQYLDEVRGHQGAIVRALQLGGQTGYFLTYEDVGDIDVMNGLARFLGLTQEREAVSPKFRKQNPQHAEDKVTNPAEMVAALQGIDRFGLDDLPVFEPRRGAVVPTYVAAARSAALCLPVASGPVAAVERWLAALDGTGPEALLRDFNRKSLRAWQKERPGGVSFAVIRHPAARLHDAFWRRILQPGPECLADIRQAMIQSYDLDLPGDPADPGYDLAAHKAAFAGFLRFVAGNVANQTATRSEPYWATQVAILQGMSAVIVPDRVVPEDRAGVELAQIAATLGRPAPVWTPEPERWRYRLAEVMDQPMQRLVRKAHQRDFVRYGFDAWVPRD